MCSRAKVRLRGKSGQALHCQCAECLAAWCKTVRASSLNVQKLRILKLFLYISGNAKYYFPKRFKCCIWLVGHLFLLLCLPVAHNNSAADKKRELLIHLFYPSPRRIKAGVDLFSDGENTDPGSDRSVQEWIWSLLFYFINFLEIYEDELQLTAILFLTRI